MRLASDQPTLRHILVESYWLEFFVTPLAGHKK
jgi:hypothetical protein